jgi:hypothetical protein
MEEVVDATGGGGRKVRATATPSAASNKNKEFQQQPSSPFSQSAGSVSRRALAFPSATLPSFDENGLHSGVTSSGQPNHSGRYSRSGRLSGRLGLENGIGVKEESDRGKVCLADSCSCRLARPSSDTGSRSPSGRSELFGEFQKTPRRAGRRLTQCTGGNVAMLRRRGLVRAVRGELDRAASSAQADQASMQVM